MARPPKFKDNMQRVALFIRPEQLEQLKAIQVKVGVPIAEQIRRAIDAYLKGHK
jgi:Ribbon-helix-helix domain